MTKHKIRERAIAKRRSFSYDEKEKKDERIFQKLLQLPEYQQQSCILTYVSLPDEIDTHRLILHGLREGKSIAVPKVEKHNIVFYVINGFSDLEVGQFHVLEPKAHCSVFIHQSALCVVPSLCCYENHRIGYGKGYYDRFLSQFDGFSVALCYQENVEYFPVSEFDEKVDIVLTDCVEE